LVFHSVAAPPIAGKARSYNNFYVRLVYMPMPQGGASPISKDLARNNFPICPASGGRAAALSLACVVPLYGASERLAPHPAKLVQIGKLFLARS
jgi:hypothetical protein